MTLPSSTLSIVVPVYGCAGCLEELVERLRRALNDTYPILEIILVDDRSPDNAWARIREIAQLHPEIKGLRLSRNFGQHYAIAAGIELARGDRVVVMDCDLQDLPEEIPLLLQEADKGHDIVFAQRIDRQDSALKRFTSWAFSKFLSYLTDVPQAHSTANFGIFGRKVIEVLSRMPERERCFPFMVRWTGFDPQTVAIRHGERSHGKSGYDFRKRLRLAAGIIMSYSDKPLRLVVKTGFCFALISILIALFSIYMYLRGEVSVAGFTSIIASIWLLGGASMFCVGVVGLYVGRLFNDAKGRPYYIVDESVNVVRAANGQ